MIGPWQVLQVTAMCLPVSGNAVLLWSKPLLIFTAGPTDFAFPPVAPAPVIAPAPAEGAEPDDLDAGAAAADAAEASLKVRVL